MFHQDMTSGTMSSLHLLESLPVVKEYMEIPDRPGDGSRWEGASVRTRDAKLGHYGDLIQYKKEKI